MESGLITLTCKWGLQNRLALKLVERELTGAYLDGVITQLVGTWGEGYAPDPDLVEWDIFESLVYTIFDYLYSRDQMFNLRVPTLQLSGQDFISW